MKRFIRLTALSLLVITSPSFADWFLSSETKALIEKAEAGDVEAQFKAGAAYDFGRGAPRNALDAIKWYTLAANSGHAEAQNSLGSLAQAEKNYPEARTWYEKAFAQGHAQATNSLAYLYDLGLGVPQDRQKGFELYSKAAEMGYAESMWNLANMYATAQLGKRDMLMACTWSVRANRFLGPRDLRLRAHLSRVLPQLEKNMSDSEFTACREKAETWTPAQVGK